MSDVFWDLHIDPDAQGTSITAQTFMIDDIFLDSMRDDPEFQKILEQAEEKHLAFKERFF